MKQPRNKQKRSAAMFLPARQDIESLKEAAAACRGCDLYKSASQTVFGEGNRQARLLLVGEQPGDQEDRIGKPFVGPAGRILNQALERAGISPIDTYVTNVVKHFKFEPRGKRRLHKTPREIEVRACYPWLEKEIDSIEPEVIICLGATAARAILGRDFRVTRERGRFFPYLRRSDEDICKKGRAPLVMATVHPSSVLRSEDDEARHQAMAQFVSDLKLVAALMSQTRKAG